MSCAKIFTLMSAITVVGIIATQHSPAAYAQQQPHNLQMERPEHLARVSWPLEVSGKTAPNARVKLILDDEPQATIRADTSGRFNYKLTGLPPKKHQMKVTAAIVDNADRPLASTTVAVRLQEQQQGQAAAYKAVPAAELEDAKFLPQGKVLLSQDGLRRNMLLNAPVRLKPGLFREPGTSSPAMRHIPAPLALDESVKPKPPGRFPRMMSEGLFGLLITSAGATAGGLAAWKISESTLGKDSPMETVAIAGGAYLGGALLLPLGIYTGGEVAGGQGSLFWTYAAGLGATGAAMYYARRPWVGTNEAIGTLILLPLIGSWLGYELSMPSEDELKAPYRARVSLLPTSDGASASLGLDW